MTIEALKASLSSVISDEDCSAEFYFLLNSPEGMHVKRADIDEAAQDELSQNFIESISANILLNDDMSLVDISSADDRAHAVYKYDLENVPTQLTKLSDILEKDNFAVFDFSADDLKNLEGILVLIGSQEQQLALYKHQYPVALLKKYDGFNLIKRNQNRLEKLDADVLRINSKFEFMRLNDQYYIVDIKALERFFGFHDAVKNVATEGVKNIEASGLIENVSVLSERLDDISFSRKLVRSAKNSPVLGKIPNADVILFIQTHPSLKGRFRLNADGTKLALDTKVSQNLFLKLLNDDFLQSELTKRYYASLAKDNITDGIVED